VAKSATVGRLNVKMTSNTMGFTKGMRNVREASRRTKTSMEKLKSFLPGLSLGFLGVGAALATLRSAFGKIASVMRETVARIDLLAKTSTRLGVTTEALSRLQHAADISGVSITVFSKAMQMMVRGVAEAAHDTGEAKDALALLGVDVAKLAMQSPDMMFLDIADAMGKVRNSADRLMIASDLFGARGAGVLVMLQEGRRGIEALAAESDALGRTISASTAKAMEDLTDSTTRATEAWKAFGTQNAEVTIGLQTTWQEMSRAFAGILNNMAGGVERLGNKLAALPLFLRTMGGLGRIGSAFGVSGDLGTAVADDIIAQTSRMQKQRQLSPLRGGPEPLASVIDTDAFANAAKKATDVLRSLETPMERYQDQVSQLYDWQRMGVLSSGQMNDALARLASQYKNILFPIVDVNKALEKTGAMGRISVLAPGMELGSGAALQASFKAQSAQRDTAKWLQDLVAQGARTQTSDDRRNTLLGRLLDAVENAPVVSMSA
jgi:hypothetical protein